MTSIHSPLLFYVAIFYMEVIFYEINDIDRILLSLCQLKFSFLIKKKIKIEELIFDFKFF